MHFLKKDFISTCNRNMKKDSNFLHVFIGEEIWLASGLVFNSFLNVVLDRSTPGVVCDAKSVRILAWCALLFSSSLYPKETGPEDLKVKFIRG